MQQQISNVKIDLEAQIPEIVQANKQTEQLFSIVHKYDDRIEEINKKLSELDVSRVLNSEYNKQIREI